MNRGILIICLTLVCIVFALIFVFDSKVLVGNTVVEQDYLFLESGVPPNAQIEIDQAGYFKNASESVGCDGISAQCYFPDIGINLTRGYAPFPVFFEGWKSNPREEIIRWLWDFGEGTENDMGGRYFEGFNAAHVFENPGNYTATLKVMNYRGEWSSPAEVRIEVLGRKTKRYVDSEIGNDAYYNGLCSEAENYDDLILPNRLENVTDEAYKFANFSIYLENGTLLAYAIDYGLWDNQLDDIVYSNGSEFGSFTNASGALFYPIVYENQGYNLHSNEVVLGGLNVTEFGTNNVFRNLTLIGSEPYLLESTIINSTVINSSIINSTIINSNLINGKVVYSKIVSTNSTGRTYIDEHVFNNWNTKCGPWKSADQAFAAMKLREMNERINERLLQPGDEILFKRGRTYFFEHLPSLGHGRSAQGIHFGAYDVGSKPEIKWSGSMEGRDRWGPPYIFSSGFGKQYWSFSDLHFNFHQKKGNQLGGFIFLPDHGRGFLFLRDDFDDPYNGVFLFHGGNKYDEPTNVFMIGSSINQRDSFVYSVTQMFGGPGRLALVNNTFDNSGNHIGYFGSLNKAVISQNVFSRPAFGRTALRITGGRQESPANNIYISENYFLGWVDPIDCFGADHENCTYGHSSYPHNGGGTSYNYLLVNLAPGGNGNPYFIQNVLFERNLLTNFQAGMDVANAENVTIRNNFFISPSPYISRFLQLGLSNSSNDNTHSLRNVMVVGNTFVTNGNKTLQATEPRFIEIHEWLRGEQFGYGGDNENITIANNIFFGINDRPIQAIAYYDHRGGSLPGLRSDNNLLSNSPPSNKSYVIWSVAQEAINYNLSEWHERTGLDLNSQEAAEPFIEPVNYVQHQPGEPNSVESEIAEATLYETILKLENNSWAIDSGIAFLQDSFYDYFGNSRFADDSLVDVGAVEYGISGENLCSNGKKDINEEGVDCGGVCLSACSSYVENPGTGGGSSGSSGSSFVPPEKNVSQINEECVPRWRCEEWGPCVEGVQKRECYFIIRCAGMSELATARNCTNETKENSSENLHYDNAPSFFESRLGLIALGTILLAVAVLIFRYFKRK